jgi:hypothetical protein
MFNSLKCTLTGKHLFTHSVYMPSQPGCSKFDVCERCGLHESREEEPHQWGPWELVDRDLCCRARTCTRCGHREKKINAHEYEWVYVSEHSCAKRKQCRICGRVDGTEQTNHLFGDWVDVPNRCEQERVCSRCPKRETRSVPHTFSEAQTTLDKCQETRTCIRCGEISTTPLPHQYGPWQYVNPSECYAVRFCTHCGIKDIGWFHDWEEYDGTGRDACKKMRRCRRCGEIEEVGELEHAWQLVREETDGRGFTRGWLYQCAFCGRTKYEENEYFKAL